MSIRAASVGPAPTRSRNRLAQVLAVGAREAPVASAGSWLPDNNDNDDKTSLDVAVMLNVKGSANNLEAELKNIFYEELQYRSGAADAATYPHASGGYEPYQFYACNYSRDLEYKFEGSYVSDFSVHNIITLKFPVENDPIYRSMLSGPVPPVRPMATWLMDNMAAHFATALEQKSSGRLRLAEPLRWSFVEA